MSQARRLLAGTICNAKSPLVSLTASGEMEQRIRYWKTRLVYLAIHMFQHQAASQEVVSTYLQPDCMNHQRHMRNIGPLDFECPNAKFLVVRLFSNGIGANMRLAAVPAFMAGLATGRVAVFVNNAPVGPDFLQNPWKLVSCPRGDMQCFFMPSTPCVLTTDELAKAPTLRKDELRSIFRNSTLSADRQSERVLILRLSFRPQREPENLRRVLYELAMPMANALAQESSDAQERSVILQAAQELLLPDPVSTRTYNYYGANSPLFHGLLFYAMRPNTRAAMSLQSIVRDSLPKDYSVEHSIGLPIRATDKCDEESECLAFPQYVRSLQSLWTMTPSTRIVVTTESRQIIGDLNKFIENQVNITAFPARFVTNARDVLQDSGYLHNQQSQQQFTAQDAMLSAISSLQLQMATRRTVGNCCSNFHLLLADFISEGCGLAHDQQFLCTQDHPDPEFRICCQWDKTPECLLRRNQSIAVD